MSYSLVNMPVLGFDLCRLPNGRGLADVVLAALHLDDAGLRRVTLPRSAAVPAAPAQPTFAGDALQGLVGRLGDPAAAVSAVDVLERSTLGDFAALVRLLRDDVLDWTWSGEGAVRVQRPDAVTAVDVLVAAAAELYDGPPAGHRPHVAALRPLVPAPAAVDLGPLDAMVRGLLTAVGAMSPAELDALRAAVRTQRVPAGWAEAVHDASWAVYLSGRLRPAAAAQLLAVHAFAGGGCTARDGAYGVWNAISGVVQATVVADMLDPDAYRLLRAPVAHLLPA